MLTQTTNRLSSAASDLLIAEPKLAQLTLADSINQADPLALAEAFPPAKPAVEAYLPAKALADNVTPKSKELGSNNDVPPVVSNYIPPGLEVLHFPAYLNSFDGFVVSGQVWGTDDVGIQVQVTLAGITRTARIRDGLWDVYFEDGAIPRHRHGSRELIATARDLRGNTARTSIKVIVEEFTEGFIQIDSPHSVTDDGGTLQATGELCLGTHDLGRELIVLLVTDDAEGQVAATGVVTPNWQFGEWTGAIPLAGVRPGNYRVRAQLMDSANAKLTLVAVGDQPVQVTQNVLVTAA